MILAVVQVGSLFSADAWNNITFTAGEVKNPKRNIPLSLVLGTGFVLTVYILATLGYLMVLPMHGDPNGATALARGIQYAAEDRVGTAALEVIFHSGGAYLMAAAIMVSTFGCANGLSLAGARVYYAMSQDGLFFKSVGKLNEKYKTPSIGLFVQACWTAVLCISGSYGQLLDYIIFAALVFYMLTILGLFVLRVKQPDATRPYKALGYPVLPALYIVMAIWICVVLLRYKPQYTWPGLAIVVLGIPVYLFWSRRLVRASVGYPHPGSFPHVIEAVRLISEVSWWLSDVLGAPHPPIFGKFFFPLQLGTNYSKATTYGTLKHPLRPVARRCSVRNVPGSICQDPPPYPAECGYPYPVKLLG